MLLETNHFKISLLTEEDILIIVQAFQAIGWHKPESQYVEYLKEQKNHQRTVWVAYLDQEFVGYVTVCWISKYEPFEQQRISEISDLNVLPQFHKRGIGTALLNVAEATVFKDHSTVGVGVGVTADYADAHRLYIKRGYLPDCKGITYQTKKVSFGDLVTVDDDLCMMFTKARKIEFHPFTADDIPLFLDWSKRKHVKDTWFLEGYEPVETIYKTMSGNGYDFPFIIYLGKQPIGYIQYCNLYAYTKLCSDYNLQAYKALFSDPEQSKGNYCIDLFIGEEAYLGKGFGSEIVEAFCDLLFSNPEVKRILVDPSMENKRAIRCYEKAGFRSLQQSKDDVCDILIMEKRRA